MDKDRHSASAQPLTVMFDGYFIDRPYGFGRYVRELAYALDRYGTVNFLVAVPVRGEPVARQLVQRGRIVAERNLVFPLWEQCVLPWLATLSGCDLIHFPYQSMSVFWPCRKSVVTLHDLMFFRPRATAQSPMDRLAHLYRRGVFMSKTRYASRIVAVSEATRTELLEQMGTDSTVIPNTCSAFVAMHPAVRDERMDPPYFLHRGSSAPHKNTANIAAAFKLVRDRFPNAELRLFGMAASDPLAEEIAGSGLRFLGKVTDSELAHLYRNARATVTASLEEGFGLAIIEAFAFGSPVITSNRSPMSDIAGDAAILVDPLDVGQIRDAMISVLENEALTEQLVVAGQRRQHVFGASRVASDIEAIYRRVWAGYGEGEEDARISEQPLGRRSSIADEPAGPREK